jgi:hypothetical protein
MERQHHRGDEGYLSHHLLWWWLRRLVLLGLEIIVRLVGGN